jgi:WD40 repeat protein
MVIWGGGDTVLVDTTTGAELFRKRDSDIGAVLSRDAGRVLSWDIEGALKLWDVSTGVEIMHLVLPARVWKAEFDPSGDRVLAWNADGTVRIWDVRYAANVRGQQLVADVCSNMLPVTAGQLRRITDADVLAAPILRGHVGDDACTVPSIWSTLWQEAARLISPGGGTVAKN